MASQPQQQVQPHFLLVSVGAQGHINPCRQLAHCLARTAGACVTISTTISAHRRMFRSIPAAPGTGVVSTTAASGHFHQLQEEATEAEGLIWYVPYSDGTEEDKALVDLATQLPEIRLRTTQSLICVASDLAARGRPVTCIIYALLMSTMAADVARHLSIPSVIFWIQPAAVFTICHHYFNRGYDAAITAVADAHADPSSSSSSSSSFNIELPGLPVPLEVQDLPSMLTTFASEDNPYHFLFILNQQLFQTISTDIMMTGRPPEILVNTFHELEASVLSCVDDIKLIPIGPLVPSSLIIQGDDQDQNPSNDSTGDLFEHDSRAGYMEWLESKEDKSVVYVSFGSLAELSKKQMEEIRRGLEECGRPYLWVVRRDALMVKNKEEGLILDQTSVVVHGGGGAGMVVEWCNQARVLSHRSVGCFVTHCGWNSTLESVVSGVPMVLLPQMADQPTIARFVEGEWGMGVRAKKSNGEAGIVESQELERCLDIVMDDQQMMMRKSAKMWKDKARAALREGGSSSQNITAFVQQHIIM